MSVFAKKSVQNSFIKKNKNWFFFKKGTFLIADYTETVDFFSIVMFSYKDDIY